MIFHVSTKIPTHEGELYMYIHLCHLDATISFNDISGYGEDNLKRTLLSISTVYRLTNSNTCTSQLKKKSKISFETYLSSGLF